MCVCLGKKKRGGGGGGGGGGGKGEEREWELIPIKGVKIFRLYIYCKHLSCHLYTL